MKTNGRTHLQNERERDPGTAHAHEAKTANQQQPPAHPLDGEALEGEAERVTLGSARKESHDETGWLRLPKWH